jgi:Fur family transcriptional regulator, ferric uptake regulator
VTTRATEFDPATILRAAGLRRTPVRVGVIESLRGAARPTSVLQLLAALPPGTDPVTVYRTLHTLVDRKLARRVRGEDRGWLFELVALDGPAKQHAHPHFVCDSCGTVECLNDVAVTQRLPASAKLSKGYEVTKQEVTLHGVCPKCH